MNPKIIQLQKIGSKSEGYLSIAEQDKNMPFEIKRVFCTYDTPTTISRGRHAHRETEMILCAIAGEITVTCGQTRLPGLPDHRWRRNQPGNT